MKTIKIIIATHKPYRMPTDSIYLPVHVGARGCPLNGFLGDNTGTNISDKNPSYCELTGLYWAWKNLQNDYIGLAHYRRHFSNGMKSKDLFECVLKNEDIVSLLDRYEIFVPSKRRYYIESLYSHYKHTHYIEQLDMTREIIRQKYPQYVKSYDIVVHQTSGYMFNMMIMRKDWLDKYCRWLFDILFELERRIDMPGLSEFQSRFYGRVSEIIFNVWLDHQIRTGQISKDKIKELPYLHMEKVNWCKKGSAFLKSKFLNQKYKGSF